MATRLKYLASPRLPRLTESALTGINPELAAYLRSEAAWSYEQERRARFAARELDSNPILRVALITSDQSIPANTWTTVAFNSVVVDTHGWWSSGTHLYTPKEPGFYRCSWGVRLGDSGAIAASTAGQSGLQIPGGLDTFTRTDGNGTGTRVFTTASTIIECDGSATTIGVQGFLSAGTAPVVVSVASQPYATFLSIDYIGRRFVSP